MIRKAENWLFTKEQEDKIKPRKGEGKRRGRAEKRERKRKGVGGREERERGREGRKDGWKEGERHKTRTQV
jgi:hypothetical protein